MAGAGKVPIDVHLCCAVPYKAMLHHGSVCMTVAVLVGFTVHEWSGSAMPTL